MDKDEINENLNQIWNLLRETHTKVSVLDTKVDTHISEESEWKPQMLQLTTAWNQATGALNFIKWCAAVGAAGTAFWTWLTQHFTPK